MDDPRSMVQEVLERWGQVVLTMMDAFPLREDFWYNERSFVSSLAAAASGLGLAALVDGKVRKRYTDGMEWSGHADLMLGSSSSSILFESKMTWIETPNHLNRIGDTLEAATAEASWLPQGTARAGLCFAVVDTRRKASAGILAMVKEEASAIHSHARANVRGPDGPGALALVRFVGVD